MAQFDVANSEASLYITTAVERRTFLGRNLSDIDSAAGEILRRKSNKTCSVTRHTGLLLGSQFSQSYLMNIDINYLKSQSQNASMRCDKI